MVVRSGEWVFDLGGKVCVNTENFCRVVIGGNDKNFVGEFVYIPKVLYRGIMEKENGGAVLADAVAADFSKCYNEYKTQKIKRHREIIFTDADGYRHTGRVAGDMMMSVDLLWIYDFKQKHCFNTVNDLHYKIETYGVDECKAVLLHNPVTLGMSAEDVRAVNAMLAERTAETYLFFYKKLFCR
jgi:glycine cleavage system protein P-like pyridoxal-binding family